MLKAVSHNVAINIFATFTIVSLLCGFLSGQVG